MTNEDLFEKTRKNVFETNESMLDGDFSYENNRNMEEWGITFDDEELLYDSKHYENVGYTISLDTYNAYDDKGNKIEGKSVKFIKKEYDIIDKK